MPVSQILRRIVIRLEAMLQANIGFTLKRALVVFNCSDNPPKVNPFA